MALKTMAPTDTERMNWLELNKVSIVRVRRQFAHKWCLSANGLDLNCDTIRELVDLAVRMEGK